MNAVFFLAGMVWLVFAASTHAQSYPARSILVISPVQAGSAGDTSLRIVTMKMSDNIGQQLVVENQPGAAGMIGMERLARAIPDGYTIGGISDSTLTYVPILQKRASYDALAVLEPISLVSMSTIALVVHPSLPVHSVKELVAIAKAQPGKIDYASAGHGSGQHVTMEMFKAATGARLTHVPYKGATQAVFDVQAGQVPVIFSALAVVLPGIKSGKLRALGVATDVRSVLLPDVPTIAESGVPGFSFSTWTGLFAPRGIPRPMLDRLHAETVKALNDPAIRARFVSAGAIPKPTTPAELAELTRATRAKMLKVIAEAGIKSE